jgi:hypothetical protein
MKRQVKQKIFEILPVILIVLGLLMGSSAQLSLPPSAQPPSAQGAQNWNAPHRAGANTTSDDSLSRQEIDRLSQPD